MKNQWIVGCALMGVTLAAHGVEITGYRQIEGEKSWMVPEFDNQVLVTNNITGYETWTSNNTYILEKSIYVEPGGALEIQPGTVIRGLPFVDLATVPGNLTVCKGAKIYARGTAGNPIIFTDMWDNNVPGMTAGPALNAPVDNPNTLVRDYSKWEPEFGYWGSVILVGNTPVAYSSDTADGINLTLNHVEGLPETELTEYGNGIAGHLNDDDDSGVFCYVQLRYGGYPLSGTKEINGLSLYGVGRGTEIHHVEVLNNLDDGFEWFGGTVNSKYLVVWACGDDGFDSDEGYRGKVQFGINVQGSIFPVLTSDDPIAGSGESDKGMEIDGGNGVDEAQPWATSQWYNMTLIGKGADIRDYDQPDANTAILLRDNAAPQIYNSIMMDFGGGVAAIEYRNDKPSSCGHLLQRAWNDYPENSNEAKYPNAQAYKTHTDGYMLELGHSVFYNFGTPDNMFPRDMAGNQQAGGVEGSKNPPTEHIDWKGADYVLPVQFDDAYYRNLVSSESPIQGLIRDTQNLVKGYAPITLINPCAANDALSVPTKAVPNDGFYSPASFSGAFSATHNWMAGWTAIDSLGLIDTAMNEVAPEANLFIGASIYFQSEADVMYRVEGRRALDSDDDWQAVAELKGNGEIMTVSDKEEIGESGFYRVIAL